MTILSPEEDDAAVPSGTESDDVDVTVENVSETEVMGGIETLYVRWVVVPVAATAADVVDEVRPTTTGVDVDERLTTLPAAAQKLVRSAQGRSCQFGLVLHVELSLVHSSLEQGAPQGGPRETDQSERSWRSQRWSGRSRPSAASASTPRTTGSWRQRSRRRRRSRRSSRLRRGRSASDRTGQLLGLGEAREERESAAHPESREPRLALGVARRRDDGRECLLLRVDGGRGLRERERGEQQRADEDAEWGEAGHRERRLGVYVGVC